MIRKIILCGALLITAVGASLGPKKNITDSDIISGQKYHWTADTTWVLNGTVFIDSGAVLVIDSGTIVQAHQEFEEEPTALVICKWAKIYANGTQNKPVIFTSDNDNPLVYNEAFDKDNYSKNKMWGGIVILGNAPVNSTTPGGTRIIPGVQSKKDKWTFGGSNANDSSGILEYVSIRFTGLDIVVASDVLMDGLTMGGVGLGTKINNVEIYSSASNGFTWYGGTVQCKHLVAAFNNKSAFDYSQGWNGRGQYWFSLQDIKSDQCVNHNGGLKSDIFSSPIISNCTFIGPSKQTAFNFSGNAGGRFFNVAFSNYVQGFTFDNSESNNLLNKTLFIKRSIFWDVGDSKSSNQWLIGPGGQNSVVSSGQLRDALISFKDTIKDPLFSDLNLGNAINPDFLQYPVSGNFNIIDTNGVLGFDLRPKAGSPLLLNTKSNDTMELWHSAENEDTTHFIESSRFIGAFASWKRPWIEKWTALWNYGMAKTKISDSIAPIPYTPVINLISEKVCKTNMIINYKNSFINIVSVDNMNTSVELFSISGRKIATLFNGYLIRGNHSFQVPSTLSFGNYICRVKAGNSIINKLTLIQK